MGIDSNEFIWNTFPPLPAGLVDEAGVDREMLREGLGSRRSVVQGGNFDVTRFGGFIALQEGADLVWLHIPVCLSLNVRSLLHLGYQPVVCPRCFASCL
jgi:hypothetical protein